MKDQYTKTNERLENLCGRNGISLKLLTTDDPDAPGVQTGEEKADAYMILPDSDMVFSVDVSAFESLF